MPSIATAALPLRVDATTRRAARIERLGLSVTSAVLLFGLWLTYSERRIDIPQIRADVTAGRIVNLAEVSSASQLVPLLGMFREPAERASWSSRRRPCNGLGWLRECRTN